FDKRSKFVHYLPEVAIINNLEFDHADIFESLDSIKTSFRHFIRLIPRNGLLLGNGDDPNLLPLLNVNHCPVKRFGLGEDNAIRATLRALRIKYPQQKVWAVFEPRTNTTRRNVFQSELATAFADADAVVVSEIARLELLAPEERLDPARLMQDLEAAGKKSAYL